MALMDQTGKAQQIAAKIAAGTKASLFLDLDGTLWWAEWIPDSARAAIEKTRARGHHLYFCTGRPIGNLPASLFALHPDGICCSAGMDLMKEQKSMASFTMPDDLVLQVIEILQSHGLGAAAATNEVVYEDDFYAAKRTAFLERENRQEALQRKSLNDLPKQAGIKKLYFDGDGQVALEPLLQDLDIDILYYFSHYNPLESQKSTAPSFRGELTWSRHNKAEALQAFMKQEEDSRLALAFGDSENDLSMMAAADLAICMGNGTTQCKEAADFISDPLDEDGLYKAFDFLGLLG